ncbi:MULTISPECIES: hypothetical protein [Xanthomonas]|uniref:hypothetical protein n=1 Tax=Xanthomonas TaxID=338 RepID=UPI000C18DF93|nr:MULTISPECIES: hypothetical protein [Xanthomonas]ATS21379.1 hypothetical protein XppCFBP412P_07785 [Xanthomonas phaseoli pv. phaseoli]ATS28874.1 hypothetical protein XppCFBP6546P_02515 [Xanthomonas phaseoli pv. phaseoli]PPV05414.1 hypothetical protein XavaCFBP5823_20820 [Xanthomonas axonopodis pv. vasculorum]QKD85163.1 hypothetical protein XAV_10150 [Xanthomonas axonopodis pv. vasculorum]QTK97492.1 hypothetical protein J6335_09055 [Xanthomonas phaseoli pv. phaseoli]
MARPTDTERGARIALDYVDSKLIQRDLFPTRRAPSLKFWREIKAIATEHLAECKALRDATGGRVHLYTVNSDGSLDTVISASAEGWRETTAEDAREAAL